MKHRSQMVPVSTHELARSFLKRPDMIARTCLLGPFSIMWAGKPKDEKRVRRRISFEELMGVPTTPDMPSGKDSE